MGKEQKIWTITKVFGTRKRTRHSIPTFKIHKIIGNLEKKMIEKRVHSLQKSDDQERTQFLKMGVKE